MFVPANNLGNMYADMEIEISNHQVLLSPKVVGRILQELDIQADESVLQIGAGTGYLSAFIGSLSNSVQVLEYYQDLADLSQTNLTKLNLGHVLVTNADCFKWTVTSQVDVLIITGGMFRLPNRIKDWVKPGGRILAFIGDEKNMSAWLLTRLGVNRWREESVFDYVLPELVNSPKPAEFVF
jgi:protein-L-isoaspartate(D-aspartate) O-methyltransferase